MKMVGSKTDALALVGGTVVDGTGAPARKATVVMSGEKIAAVLDAAAPVPTGNRRVDCSGQVVCPGFIDMHSHEFTILTDRRARSKIAQGVTTEISGNCGMSMAPASTESGKAEVLSRLRDFGFYRGRVDWGTMEEYLAKIEAAPPWTNTVQLLGLGTVRACVMGYAARSATSDELAKMKRLVAEGMAAGCRGVSTGLIYPPGCYSSTDEIVELARVAAQHGGLYFSHIRGEGDTVAAAVAEAVEVGRRSGCGVHIAHFKALGRQAWGSCERTREIVARANDGGIDATYDVYPYHAASTVLSAILPDWAHEGGTKELLRRLNDSVARARMRDDMAGGRTMMKGATFDDILIVRSAAFPERTGQTVGKIAAETGRDPCDVAFDILAREPGILMVLFGMNPEEVKANLLGPHAMVGSDAHALDPSGTLGAGCPHPRSYGTFPRVIKWLALDEKACLLEEIIAKMTGKAARKLGLADRGVVREGAAADIVVFDPARLADTATFTEPHKFPDGIEAVYVGGRLAWRRGRAMGEPSGQVLRWRG